MKAMKRSRVAALVGPLLVVACVTAACDDSDDRPGGAAGSPAAGAGGGGAAGESAGRSQVGGGGDGREPSACDCGEDPRFVHVPLDCACAAGLCTTLDEDLQQEFDRLLGWPYTVLRGTCASDYHVLWHQEACENAGARTYDAQGKLVYSSYGPYGSPPAVCNPHVDSSFGDFGIGAEDPAKDCQFCLLAYGDLAGDGGAGGTSGSASFESCIADDLAKYPPCEPSP